MTTLRERYVDTLYWSLSVLGVDETVERTVLAAVTIQFLVSLAQTAAPVVLPSGPIRPAVQTALLVGAAVAFGNTAIIARRNVIRPIERLQRVTESVAAGNVPESSVTADPAVDPDQPDEIGDLARSVEEMRTALLTVERQADALAARSFDDDVFDTEVPGEFGDALSEMRAELTRYTAELETVIAAFGDAADAARGGDLTARVDPDAVAAEYETLARDFDSLLDTLTASLTEADEFADHVAAATDDVGSRARELRSRSETVAESVEEITDATDRQRRELSTASRDVSDLSATVEEIAASTSSVRETTSDAADLAAEGREEATAAVDELEAVADRIETTTETVETLVEAVDEVGEIAAVIEGLAEQTKMLAINASVEAARADGASDAADGFAVVAEEVQQLSDAGQERAGEIQATADRLQRRADAAATEVRDTRSEVLDTVDDVEAVLGRFDDLAAAVAEIDDGVAEVSEATDQQARVAEELAGHVGEVEELAVQTADDTETVAEAAERQVETVEAVAADAASLSEDADRLSALFDQFTLPDDSGDESRVADLGTDERTADEHTERAGTARRRD